MDFIVEHLIEFLWTCATGALIFILTRIWKNISAIINDIQLMKEALKESLHEQIVQKCTNIIQRGYATADELDEIHAINVPYMKLHGNSTAKRAIEKVYELPLK